MYEKEAPIFSLEMFEGPLEFLLQLIQKNEIHLSDVPVVDLIHQYMETLKEGALPDVDQGAEFVGTTSLLLWMKSRMLLPKHEELSLEDEAIHDPAFAVIYHLIDYCRFKDLGQKLQEFEEEQGYYHTRGVIPLPEVEKKLGIEHLDMESLAKLFRDVLTRAKEERGTIREEEWRVADKIAMLRAAMKAGERLPFYKIFSSDKPKGELIVTFLAVLELMKTGEVMVGKDTETEEVVVYHG